VIFGVLLPIGLAHFILNSFPLLLLRWWQVRCLPPSNKFPRCY